MSISENGVSFFGSGGHTHNGVNSTLIDVGSYSLFDFSLGYTGSQSRINRQSTNQIALEEWIIRTVNAKVLQPSGLDLAPDTLSGKAIRSNTITATQIQANTITADQIAANTITANELSSNIVLINNTIRSNNYVANTSGWRISNNGNAEFVSGRVGPFSISVNGLTNVGNIGDYSYTNYLGIENYGDLTVYSNPTSGPHVNLYHKTSVVGEFIQIQRTDSSFNPSTSGAFIGYQDNTNDPLSFWRIANNNYSVINSSGLLFVKPSYSTKYYHDGAEINGNVLTTQNMFVGENQTIHALANFATSGSSTTARLTNGGIITGWDSLARPVSLRSLKENIEDIDDAISILSDLRPRKYNFKVDAFSEIDPLTNEPWTNEAREFAALDYKYGFIVEEIAEKRPDLLSHTFEHEEGVEPNYLDFSKWKPTMWEDVDVLVLCVKAIQELTQKNSDLEARLQALEGV